jgi:hypothetical protein
MVVIAVTDGVPADADHTLFLDSDVAGYAVIGGGSFQGIVKDNSVHIEDPSAAAAHVFGGAATYLSASTAPISVVGNSVAVTAAGYAIEDKTLKEGSIVGGGALAVGGPASVKGNMVVFHPGSAAADIEIYAVSGGIIRSSDPVNLAGSGEASENSVTFESGSGARIYWLQGAYADGSVPDLPLADDSSVLQRNKVEVLGDDDSAPLHVTHDVIAAFLHKGKAPASGNGPLIRDNEVILERGLIDGYAVGGYGNIVSGATVRGNSVEISGNTRIGGGVFGGGVDFFIDPSGMKGNTVAENSVRMTGGTVGEDVVGGRVTGGAASSNRVELSGGRVAGFVAGGHAVPAPESGDAISNSVTVTGAASVAGGVFGGLASGGKADGNRVLIEGLETPIGGAVYGGYVAAPADASALSADRNSVTVRDSGLNSDVYGGFIAAGAGTANRNTVTLSGAITLGSAAPSLFGGGGAGAGDRVAGNALVMDKVTYGSGNASFSQVGGFESYTFAVTPEQAAKAVASSPSPVALLEAGTIRLGTGAASAKLRVEVTGAARLAVGQELVVLKASDSLTGDIGSVAVVSQDLFKVYSFRADRDAAGKAVVIEVAKVDVREDANAVSEVPLADVSFVNVGGDAIAARAIPAAAAGLSEAGGVSPFAAVGYGRHRAETGSHVDVTGVTGDIGVAFGTGVSAGRVLAGAFLEFGEGSFDSYSDFAGLATVHGEGDLSYIGGGAFARLDIGEAGSSHPYLEGSVRYGKTDADFRTRNFQAAQGREVSYDMDARYWGFHFGGGYLMTFGGSDGSLDLSAKYYHLRRDGDDFDIDGDNASLGPVTSSRIKAGARQSIGITPSLKAYFGAYFEHEFDGDSRLSYAGTDLPKVSLAGSTGVGELGLTVKPGSGPLELQLGVQGSIGRREGVSAELSLRLAF